MSTLINSRLLQQLKRHEGYRRFPYKDSVGVLTIGIGRNLDEVGISEHEAEYLLYHDVDKALLEVSSKITGWEDLNDIRKQVLINMAFNMGITRLLKFKKMLKAIAIGDYMVASLEMLDSKWATQVGQRANELSYEMKYGISFIKE